MIVPLYLGHLFYATWNGSFSCLCRALKAWMLCDGWMGSFSSFLIFSQAALASPLHLARPQDCQGYPRAQPWAPQPYFLKAARLALTWQHGTARSQPFPLRWVPGRSREGPPLRWNLWPQRRMRQATRQNTGSYWPPLSGAEGDGVTKLTL